MKKSDIRWQQRLDNYSKAVAQLEEGVELQQERELSNLEIQGVIQGFKYTYELAWNVMKDYFIYQGNPNISGARDAVRTAFKNGLVEDGKTWMEMIRSRNKTSHTYDEAIATAIYDAIIRRYYPLLEAFAKKMNSLL